ncbi:MAG: hypothetical protein KA149_00300 [Chitinophagales bacterium]|nr:hypothetical protein [Chitinophagales bacterium]
MKTRYIIIIITCILLAFSACKEKDDTALPSSLYVSGYTSMGGATLWKNGIETALPGTANARTTSLFVSGTDVYVTGFEDLNGSTAAVYWKSGTPNYLTNGATAAQALDVWVSGTDVHVVGFESNGSKKVAMHWKNGVPYILSSGLTDCEANSICISGGDVYILLQETNAGNARYLKNGVPTTLTDPSNAQLYANDIVVQGNDVYVSGYGDYNSIYTIAKYWKNGVRTNLGAGVYSSEARTIFVSGTDIYVAGLEKNSNTFSVATYWKNGVAVSLPDGTDGYVNSTFVYCNDVYMAGETGMHAKYWKNGVPVDLSSDFSALSGIVMK